MRSYILQNWTTIRGASSTTITQSESDWLDLAPFQDVSIYLDVREFTGVTPVINFQTSPNKDDALFLTMPAGTGVTLTLTPANPTLVRLGASPAIPLARYLRWQLVGPATLWDATFRVLVSANALGL